MPTRRVDRRLQCGYSATLVLLTTRKALLHYQVTQQGSATPWTMRDRQQDKAYPTLLKTSFATPSHKNHSIVIGFQPP
jgi:hypothetical protein